MGRNHPLKLAAVSMLCAFAAIISPGAQAQTISNTASASWTQSGEALSVVSNSVTFQVSRSAATVETFVVGAGPSVSLIYKPAICGNVAVGGTGQVSNGIATAAVARATTVKVGDIFYFRLVAQDANLHADSIDSVDATITNSSGDREVVRVFETSVNSGIFIGAVPTVGIPPQPQQGDCRMSIASGDVIKVDFGISGLISPLASTQINVLADPYGLVFDSEDGSPVNGAKVTIVSSSGAPVSVFADDGVTSWPSVVYTGASVSDGNGIVHQLLPGEYRFPLVNIGQYKVIVEPPTPYKAPSAATPAQLTNILRPDGNPVLIGAGSYGAVFTVPDPTPVRVDIPVDRPPVAVALTKTVSRATAQPGDQVFYTVTAHNLDVGRIKRGVILVDTPSSLLRLRANSVLVDGIYNPNVISVSGDGGSLTVRLGDIAAGATRVVTYAMAVRPNAPPGQALNKAVATDARGLSSVASAVLRIEQDGLTSRMTLIGRITDGDCRKIGPRIGIPGVRVMMEDGSFAITDRDGRYHFDGLVPGDHVVQVTDQTLPEGGFFVNCGQSTRNAGSAISRFVSGQGGSLLVADFYAHLPEVAHNTLKNMQHEDYVGSKGAEDKGLESGPKATDASKAKLGTKATDAPVNEVPLAEVDLVKAAHIREDRISAGAETNWLAMGNGPTDFLFPTVDHNPRAPVVRVVIRHKPGQKIELSSDGKPVDAVASDGSKVSDDRSYAVTVWRGIPLDSEITHLTAVVRNGDGTVETTLHRDVRFTQTAAKVEFLAAQSKLIADGRTKPVIAIRVLDRAGRPVHAGITGEVNLSAPYESAEAIAAMQSRALTGLGRSAPHWTVAGDDGVALIELAPTMVSGALTLDFSFSDGQQRRRQTLESWVVPGDLKWTLVGLAEGSVGSKTIADAMERSGRFNSDLGDHGRVAFYAKGRVLGKYLLTLAYDSAKQKDDQRLMGAIDPRAYYSVFADGADRRFDAASREKLYVRLEARAFYALFGDYESGFTQTQLARYMRTMTGVKVEGNTHGVHFQGFGAKVSTTHRRFEVQGGGISGPYNLNSKAIVANSETVVIESRDRLRSELIVDS
ncbi:MAG: hypothetical protein RLY97_2324, partial [Pseudomonadota bacterium]